MGSLLEFARGPLFRFSFTVMVLGLARILFIDIWGAYKAYSKAGDKKMPWQLIRSRGFEWVFPMKRIIRNPHIYSVFSIFFHIGLIIVPIFLFAHINLWKQSVGVSWPALPYHSAMWLTVATIFFAAMMLFWRAFVKSISSLSRGQDYLWLLLLLVPFITGFVCANLSIGAGTYRFVMLVHTFSADLIFLLMPFSKIAHCVLAPLSQVVGALAWKFPPETDHDISLVLNKSRNIEVKG